ncbi:MAG: hypothetical protein ACOC2H_02010 [Spirochaetota bacterium]
MKNHENECERLRKENDRLRDAVQKYEELIGIYEKRLAGSDDIIRMFEHAIDFSREEMIEVRKTIEARERVAKLCDEEKKQAYEKIKQLKLS